jgi:RNA polymerase sigma-70 factor (ECF subfamily)
MNSLNCEAEDARDMARLLSGHEAALDDLMGRHAEKLFRYLVRSLQDESDAADLAQETFVRVYQNRARFESGQKFSTWLFAIASNLVRDRYRWRSRHPQVSLEAENVQTEASLKDTLRAVEPAPDEKMQADERAATVRKAVAALPEELRQPLILALYEDLPQSEIALILKCSVKAVETRIYRARHQLRESLQGLIETP